MKDNFQQQASREVLVAREFLKAACGQQSAEGDASRLALASRFDFLTKYQAQPPLDPSLSLISKQWVPVGTKPAPTPEVEAKAGKTLLHTAANPTAPVGKDQPASDAGLSGLGLVGQRLLPHIHHIEGDDAMRGSRKRERSSSEVVPDVRWTLKQKLAALSQDIELLTQEIAMVRDRADASCATPKLTLEEKALIAERHAKKQADAQKRGVSVMLRDIMAHKFANPFLKPVDTKLYPDYPLKVNRPLDFGTVKSRLDAGTYSNNIDAFVKDMGQIFDNAFLYNAPGSTVHGWAVTLKEKFEERLKNLNTRLSAMEGEQRKEEEDILDIAKRRLQDKAGEALASERQRYEPLIAGVEARIKQLKADSAASCTFVSQSDKHALMEALNELKTEDFEQAMQIILHRHPGLLQANSEVLNIDFGPLDALTLRQLAAFCSFCLKGTNPEFANSWPGLLFGGGARGIAAPAGGEQVSVADEPVNLDGSNQKKPKLDPLAVPEPERAQADAALPRDSTALPTALSDTKSAPTNPQEGHIGHTVPVSDAAVKALSVQTREVGERSWSVLDTQAVTDLRRGLSADDPQTEGKQ